MDGRLTLSAFDVNAQLANTIPLLAYGGVDVGCWSPCGIKALLHATESSRFWVWEVASGRRPDSCQLWCGLGINSAAWSLDSTQLLMSGAQHLVVWSLQSGRESIERVTGKPCMAAMGSSGRAAVLQRPPGFSSWDDPVLQDLHIYKAADSGVLTSVTSLSIKPHLCFNHESRIAVSPDGAYLAVHTMPAGDECPDKDWNDAVAIVDFDGCLLKHVPISWAPDSLEWAADGASLLCSTRGGNSYILLDFA